MSSRDEPAPRPRTDAVRALEARGFAIVPGVALTEPRSRFASAPAMLERLVGQWPAMLERQPIRAVPGGRSFASSNVFAPFHTDSQDFLGAPPSLQILVCHQAAARGGETLLLDTWSLLARIEKGDARLFSALFSESRRIPFYFGDVDGATVAIKRGHFVFTHSPMPPRDPIGRALAPWIERERPIEIALHAGDMLIVDNHRMLHGRRAFEGAARELERLLVWLPEPVASCVHYARMARAHPSADNGDLALPPRALRIVEEMVAGTPPGVLAAREGIQEALLYRWRNAVMSRNARSAASASPGR